MDDDRYQYSPKQRTSNNDNINSANTSPVTIKSAFLDAIREEVNEESDLKKKKKNKKSDLARASLETNRSRTGIDMIPGQQRNGLSSVSHATQTSHTATYYGLDSSNTSGKEESSVEESVAQLAISGPRTATQGARQGAQPSLLSIQVGELDSRINEMEMLVTYKLVDIESKVCNWNLFLSSETKGVRTGGATSSHRHINTVFCTSRCIIGTGPERRTGHLKDRKRIHDQFNYFRGCPPKLCGGKHTRRQPPPHSRSHHHLGAAIRAANRRRAVP